MTDQSNMAFHFQHSVRSVLVVIHTEFLIGNIHVLSLQPVQNLKCHIWKLMYVCLFLLFYSHECRYEDDQIIGHRLYREIRKTEVVQMKKGKPRGSQVFSNTTYQWETVATNFDEFQDVSVSYWSSSIYVQWLCFNSSVFFCELGLLSYKFWTR